MIIEIKFLDLHARAICCMEVIIETSWGIVRIIGRNCENNDE